MTGHQLASAPLITSPESAPDPASVTKVALRFLAQRILALDNDSER